MIVLLLFFSSQGDNVKSLSSKDELCMMSSQERGGFCVKKNEELKQTLINLCQVLGDDVAVGDGRAISNL